jgi:LacI family transcriptional regulator
VLDFHAEAREWLLIELHRYQAGHSPLPERDLDLAGAIVWAEPQDAYVRRLVDQGMPVVNCGLEWEGMDGIMRVHAHITDLLRQVVRHFQALGLPRTVALGFGLDHRPATLRVLEQYRGLAAREGMAAEVRDIGGKDSPGASPERLLGFREERELGDFLAALPKPAGLFCSGDAIGHLVTLVARHRGLAMPQDLAVLCMGGGLMTRMADPSLTSICAPARQIGRKAAEAMSAWLATGCRPAAEWAVPGALLVPRESTVRSPGGLGMEALRRFIQLHAAKGLGMEDLTRRAGLSAKTLTQHYELAFGIKPLDEIRVQRLAEARRLLNSGELPVAEVAKHCGFSSVAAFHNYFKRHTGRAPGSAKRDHPGKS